MMHNFCASLFLWILGQLSSKNKFLKIPQFVNEKQKSGLDDKKCFELCYKTAQFLKGTKKKSHLGLLVNFEIKSVQ